MNTPWPAPIRLFGHILGPSLAAPVRAECRGGTAVPATLARPARKLAFALALACTGLPAGAWAAVSFALVADAPAAAPQRTETPALWEHMSEATHLAFVVVAPAPPGLDSPVFKCEDSVYQARRAWLDASPLPVVVVPGAADWTACAQPAAGGYDPVERLDFTRETYFPDGHSLGQHTLDVLRESDTTRFRPYRENMRWSSGGVTFVTLNLPADNNHYVSGGGRNGEFEDRTIANRHWLEAAAAHARRAQSKAMVIVVQGDPHFGRDRRHESFSWLRFTRRGPRDGFLEFRRDLQKIAERFEAPILLVHAGPARPTMHLRLDRPLENAKGVSVANLTRLQFFPGSTRPGWVRIDVDPQRRPIFHARLHIVEQPVGRAAEEVREQSTLPDQPDSGSPP